MYSRWHPGRASPEEEEILAELGLPAATPWVHIRLPGNLLKARRERKTRSAPYTSDLLCLHPGWSVTIPRTAQPLRLTGPLGVSPVDLDIWFFRVQRPGSPLQFLRRWDARRGEMVRELRGFDTPGTKEQERAIGELLETAHHLVETEPSRVGRPPKGPPYSDEAAYRAAIRERAIVHFGHTLATIPEERMYERLGITRHEFGQLRTKYGITLADIRARRV